MKAAAVGFLGEAVMVELARGGPTPCERQSLKTPEGKRERERDVK